MAMHRYLFYSHDGVGLGHTCRNLAIAEALTTLDRDATVLLATGTDSAMQLGLPRRVEILKLPGLRKVANESYASRRLMISQDRIRALRSQLLAGAVEAFGPDALLVDKHPLGAGGELKSALALARAQGARTVLGLRDILDDADTVRAEWEPHRLVDRVSELYDQVLIYGQPEVYDPIAEYGFPEGVSARSAFCGYVHHTAEEGHWPVRPKVVWPRTGRPQVMATVGGGEDGERVLRCFIEAARGAAWSAIAVTGPLASEETKARLRAEARSAGVVLHEFVPRLSGLFREVGALVCMGGYNTLTEALSAGVPVVCVPRVEPRREQWLRAHAFDRLGLLQCLHPSTITAESLRVAVQLALAQSRPAVSARSHSVLAFDGAQRAAEVIRAGVLGRSEADQRPLTHAEAAEMRDLRSEFAALSHS